MFNLIDFPSMTGYISTGFPVLVLASVEDLSRIAILKTSEMILFSIYGLVEFPEFYVESTGGIEVTGPVVVFLEGFVGTVLELESC